MKKNDANGLKIFLQQIKKFIFILQLPRDENFKCKLVKHYIKILFNRRQNEDEIKLELKNLLERSRNHIKMEFLNTDYTSCFEDNEKLEPPFLKEYSTNFSAGLSYEMMQDIIEEILHSFSYYTQ